MLVDLSFQGNYQVNTRYELPGFPNYKEILHYPGGGVGADGVIVQVTPQDAPAWIGIFAFGGLPNDTSSGVFSCPGGTRLCVVSRGRGYVITASAPAVWEEVPVTPILFVRPVPEKDVILFASHHNLAVYGSQGIVWRAKCVVDDELAVAEVARGVVRGTGWDAAQGKTVEFAISVETGLPTAPRKADP